MEDQIRRAFHFGPAFIDDHQMAAMEHVDQLGSGSHFQGCPPYDQAVRPADQVDGVGIGRLGQEFPVQGHIRPDCPAADRAAGHRIRTVKYKIYIVLCPAGHAVILPDGAVYLLYILTACLLVQAVYVLGDHAPQPARSFHLRKLSVGRVGFHQSGIQILPVVVKKKLRLLAQAFAAEQVFGFIAGKTPVLFLVEPVLTPEIRDAAFCRDPGTAQKHDAFRLEQDLREGIIFLRFTEAVVISVFFTF